MYITLYVVFKCSYIFLQKIDPEMDQSKYMYMH